MLKHLVGYAAVLRIVIKLHQPVYKSTAIRRASSYYYTGRPDRRYITDCKFINEAFTELVKSGEIIYIPRKPIRLKKL